MADTKRTTVSMAGSSAKSKRGGKNSPEDPYATARVRAILDPEETDLVSAKLAEIQSTGAQVAIAATVEGSIERIVSIGGTPEVVGKGYGAVLRVLHGVEPVEKEVKDEDGGLIAELRVVMPAVFATPLTRPSYPILQTIHTETTATLTLNQSVLPLSTERLLIVRGSIHAVSKAVQKISEYLQNSYEHYASIQNGAKPPVVWYVPLPVYGSLGAPENYDLPRVIQARMMTPQNPFGIDPKVPLAPQPSAQPQQQVLQQGPTQIPGPMVGGPAGGHGIQAAVVGPGGRMTQQIFIPNDMVGAIIGKGGAKINEIRQMSGSHIKINEPAENSNERLVTITGTQDCNQMALYMLYSRLESEKHRM